MTETRTAKVRGHKLELHVGTLATRLAAMEPCTAP